LEPGQYASWRSDVLQVGVSGAEVRRALKWLEKTCRQREVPQALAERLALCLHEALVNVINHGGASAAAVPVEVVLEVAPGADSIEASVTVSDAGRPFDPLSTQQKPLPKTLDEALPGGLGLRMIRRCADRLGYRHEDGRNHFTFGARWNAQPQPK
jgi:anti-sigma regulatory factor (Ser/Thr protein kinase)